jgi:hypothetical protein
VFVAAFIPDVNERGQDLTPLPGSLIGPTTLPPVVFEEFGGILVAGSGGRRRHLRLAELCVIECFQVEG